MNSRIKFIIFLVLAVFLISIFSYWRAVNNPAAENRQDQIFIISSGEGVTRISKNLFNAGLIKSQFYFKIYVWQISMESKFQAGEYALNPSMPMREIAEVLTAGRSLSKEKKIKIIEGWNIRNIDKYLKESNIILDGSFIELAEKGIINYKFPQSAGQAGIIKMEFLNDAPQNANLEGYLFPDTYKIYQDATAEDIIQKMLVNFDKKLTDEIRAEINKQSKTVYEIITMASVIEKEVRTIEDMEIVSGIFWDRIKYGQPLESCATLAYILGINKKQYTIEDTKINSPYNTYQNCGLPPGPICNPGFNAIKAAVYPEFTDYNYFLSSKDKGETIFSKTFDEHNMNKAKYLR